MEDEQGQVLRHDQQRLNAALHLSPNAAKLRAALGVQGAVAPYKKRVTTVSLSPAAYQGLQNLAALFDFQQGRGPNVSGLLEAIGLGLLLVDVNPDIGVQDEGGGG